MACINKSLPEYTNLKDQFGKIEDYLLTAKIRSWQKDNNKSIDEFPTYADLNPNKDLIQIPDNYNYSKYPTDDKVHGSRAYANSIANGVSYFFFRYFTAENEDGLGLLFGDDAKEHTEKAYKYAKDKFLELKLNGNPNVVFALQNWEITKAIHMKYLEGYKIKINDYSELFEDESENDGLRGDSIQRKILETSVKKSASSLTRILVATMEQVTYDEKGNAVPVLDKFGMPKMIDFGAIYNMLINKLSNVTSIDEIRNKLKELEDSGVHEATTIFKRAHLGELINSVEKYHAFMQFLQAMTKYKENFVITTFSADGNVREYNLTEETTHDSVRYTWKANEEQRRTKDAKEFYNPDKSYNADEFRKVFGSNFKYQDALEFLKVLGIEFVGSENFTGQQEKEVLELAVELKDSIIKKSVKDSTYLNNLFADKNHNSSNNLKRLTKIAVDTSPKNFNENIVNTVKGTKMYSNRLFSFLTRTIANLQKVTDKKTFEKLFPHLSSLDTYSQHSIIKDRAIEGKANVYTEIINGNRIEDSEDNAEYDELSEADRIKIGFAKHKKNKYPLLIPSDNKLAVFIHLGELLSDVGVNESYVNQMVKYLEDELNFLANIDESISDVANSGIVLSLIKEQDKTLFDILLNSVKTNSLLAIRDNIDKIEKAITDYTNQEIDVFFKKVYDNGLIDFNADGTKKSDYLGTTKVTENDVRDEIGIYFMNSIIADIEQTKIITGNPVFYKQPLMFFKRMSNVVSTKDFVFNDKEVNSIVDQFAGVSTELFKAHNREFDDSIATNIGTQYSEDNDEQPIIKEATFEDATAFTDYFDQFNLTQDEKGKYHEMVESDGYGEITMDAWRQMWIRAGKWEATQEGHEGWYQAEIQKALKIPRRDWVFVNPFTKETSKFKANPKVLPNSIKTHGFGSTAGYVFTVQIQKCSYGILSPSNTMGKKNDIRRIQMNKQGIGLATNKSGKKVGAPKIANTHYNNVGNANSFENLIYQEIPVENIAPQLETGTKIKHSVMTGTQMMKHIISHLFEYGKPNSKIANSEKLYNDFIKANNKRVELGLAIFKEKLGIEEENGGYRITNKEKFRKMATEEIERRELPYNAIEGLERMLKGSEINIDTLINRIEIEYIISAMADKLVIRQKRNGRASYQQPSTLQENDTFQRAYVVFKRLPDNSLELVKKDVKDISTYDPNTHVFKLASNFLKFYTNENGKVTRMQVGIPSYFKDSVDKDKITDKRLLELIGFRIPTQGLNSIEAIEPMWLPREYGDNIILPTEIVAKAGSDYDIDKMNIYIPNFFYDEDGNPVYIDNIDQYDEYVKIRNIDKEEIEWSRLEFEKLIYENKLVETMGELLLHPSNFENLITPISNDDLNGLAKKVAEMRGLEEIMRKDKFCDIVNLNRKADLYQQFMEGKDAIARTALAGTFHIAAQQNDFYISKDYTDADGKKQRRVFNLPHNGDKERISLGGLTSVETNDSKDKDSIPKLFMQWVNASVDNAKELVLKKLNAGLDAINVWMFLTAAGTPKEHIAYFMNQPIILQYLANKKRFQSHARKAQTEEKDRDILGNKYVLEQTLKQFGLNDKNLKLIEEDKPYSKALLYNNRDNKSFQGRVLAEFLYIEEMASYMVNAQQALSYDNNSIGKNVSELSLKLQVSQNALQSNIIENLDKALNYKIKERVVKLPQVKNHSMKYSMPANKNLTGKDTTTLDLIESELRTASTRSYPLGKVGDIITFENNPQQYVITQVEELTEENTTNPEWIKEWSQKEQWTEEYFKEVLGGKTVHIGSFQTTFKKAISAEEETLDSIGLPEEVETKKVQIDFQEEQSSGYRERTIKNASADATIAIAVDFDSAGEKLTRSSVQSQMKKYIPVHVTNSLERIESEATLIVRDLNSISLNPFNNTGLSLNIAGNGIYTMRGKYTQQQVDDYTYKLLKAVTESPNLKNKITSIRTGGQTGFDEAGAKAGIKLGIPTTILAPKGWKFRDISGTDISNEKKFKERFETTQETVPQETTVVEIIPLTTNFSRSVVSKDQEYIYLFTDNAGRTSGSNKITPNWYTEKYNKEGNYPTTTQAVIRGLDNAMPITTMVDDKRTQWTDNKFDFYKAIIDDEIQEIKDSLNSGKYKGIKFSAQMPFGKGKISNMKFSAPKIWSYLNSKLLEIGIDNSENTPKAIKINTEIKVTKPQVVETPKTEVVASYNSFHQVYYRMADVLRKIQNSFSKVRSDATVANEIDILVSELSDKKIKLDDKVKILDKFINAVLTKALLTTEFSAFGKDYPKISDMYSQLMTGSTSVGSQLKMLQELIRKGDKGELTDSEQIAYYKAYKDNIWVRNIIIPTRDIEYHNIKQPRKDNINETNAVIESYEQSADPRIENNMFIRAAFLNLLQAGVGVNPMSIRTILSDNIYGEIMDSILNKLTPADWIKIVGADTVNNNPSDIVLEWKFMDGDDSKITPYNYKTYDLPDGTIVKQRKLKDEYKQYDKSRKKLSEILGKGINPYDLRYNYFVIKGGKAVPLLLANFKNPIKNYRNDASVNLYGRDSLGLALREIKAILTDNKKELEEVRKNCKTN